MPPAARPSPLDYGRPRRTYERPTPRTVGSSVPWGWIGGCVVVLLLGALLLLPLTHRGTNCGNSGKCLSNLHQLGLAILLYQGDNGGRYPDTLGQVLVNEQITFECFVCPSGNDTPATQSTAAALSPGHCSYVYLGQGLTAATVTPTMLVVYERLAIHGNGWHMLFGDGHAEFVDAVRGKPLVAAARAAAATRVPTTRPVVATAVH